MGLHLASCLDRNSILPIQLEVEDLAEFGIEVLIGCPVAGGSPGHFSGVSSGACPLPERNGATREILPLPMHPVLGRQQVRVC